LSIVRHIPRILAALGLLALIWCGPGGLRPALAQTPTPPTDAQVKAAMVYNLAKFVEWPGESPADGASPLLVCWLGDGQLSTELQALQGKTIRNRPIVVRQARQPEEIGSCQLLVIDAAQRAQLPAILKLVRGSNTFAISDMQGFADAGGMLGFVTEAGRVRFEINLEAINATSLKVSSQVLSLAVSVKGGTY